MKKKIINGLLFAVALVAATSSFVSCKDYNGDNYAELQEKYLTLQAAFDKQVAAMQDYVLTSKYNKEVGENYNHVKTIQQRLIDLETDTAALAKRISDNDIAIKEALAEAKEEIMGFAKRDSQRLANLVCPIWGNNLDEAISKAAEVLATVAKDSTTWNETSETVKNRKAEWDRAVEVADKAWAFVDNTTTKDGKKIESLQDLVNAYEGADEALKEDIAALKEDVDNILATLQKEVTGITIQGTYNPIFGSFAYPIDVQSNILATYYGEVINAGELGYEFPAGDEFEDVWASGKPAILDSELEAISPKNVYTVKDGILMVEGKGNAGKLYLTVNPSNVDFEKASFTLRASDNTISKVQLSPLEASTEQLKWGYNRAASENSPNGFYVANATIDSKDVKDVTLSFNLKGIASDVQSIMQDWSKTSAADIAKLALKVVEGMKTDAPRLGVQYQWKDATSENPWKNYVSKYDLAAVSVKPLGFDFLNDAHYHEGIVKFKNKLTAKEKAIAQELINEIAQALVFELKLPATTSTNVKIDGDGNVKIVLPAGTIYDGSEVLIGKNTIMAGVPADDIKMPVTPKAGGYEIDITALIQSMGTAINNQLSKVSDTATGTINKYLDKIINFENKIFGKIESVAKNPNRYLQPALIGNCNQFKGYFYPSRNYLAPTQVQRGQKIMFYPTTLTGETVVPAFKKYVAISGVWKVSDISSTDDAKAANDAAGEKLNTVFDGAEFNIQNGFEINTGELKAGYVYEFIYECLGYNGKVAGKKYYIEVYE